MTSTPADLIHTYFAAAVDPDRESYVALFAPDAAVEDDGRSFTGRDAVRRWRADVPQVDYAPGDVAPDDGGWAVPVTIAGDFPGTPVDLRFWFRFDEHDLVAELRIRP